MRTIAVLPVKSFPAAKQRLSGGLDPPRRAALAEAMFTDVLEALGRARLDGILVVTAFPGARRIACERDVTVVEDQEAGHNAAAALGVQVAKQSGAERILLVPGDCPALDPAEIDQLLARPATPPCALIVPDRHGTGTNALLIAPPDALSPSFGPGSCQRHLELARERGTDAELVELPSLALDIDTPDDLDALSSSGDLAVRTRQLVARC
jgi:2-phospho-L-lactate guanylyltransferase